MRISDWSSDVCSSDLTESDTSGWGRAGQQNRPTFPDFFPGFLTSRHVRGADLLRCGKGFHILSWKCRERVTHRSSARRHHVTNSPYRARHRHPTRSAKRSVGECGVRTVQHRVSTNNKK